MSDFLIQLQSIIKDRAKNPSNESYTSQLIESGIDRVLRKVGEESAELIIASKNHDSLEIKNEAADLVYHLLVLLEMEGLSFSDVVATLEQRHR